MLVSAIVFTAAAAAIVGLSAWWLYLSPLRGSDGPSPVPPTLAVYFAAGLGLASALMVGGALWDASMHLQTGLVPGGSDFLWPPHLLIYGAFLLSFAIGACGILVLVLSRRQSGSGDPRRWVRANPMIGAVVLASAYTLFAIPGDALWHELVGPDLTAWSPPHIVLAAASTAVVLCGVGLLLQVRRDRRPSLWLDLGLFLLFGLSLNVLYTVGVLEWELPGELGGLVAQRPAWAYPIVAGGTTFFVLALARFSTRSPMSATATAAAFYLFRQAAAITLHATGNLAPVVPLWILPAALVIDLVPWRRIRRRSIRDAALAGGFSLAFGMTALLDLMQGTSLRPFSVSDAAITILGQWLLCLPLTFLARAAGAFLGGEAGSRPRTAASFSAPPRRVDRPSGPPGS
jgi:hypothetical protein